MKKKLFISFLLALVLSAGCISQTTGSLTDQQILELIQKHRPSKGGELPKDLKDRLGATHMDGQYYFTNEPYIIEGAKKMNELGYGILKLWFSKADGNQGGYRYNSDWKLTRTMTLKELAQHQYYKVVFDMPFKVFALNINDGYGRASTEDQTETLMRVETEMYDLTKYLLTQFNRFRATGPVLHRAQVLIFGTYLLLI